MYEITLPIDFSGERYGITFFRSKGRTSDKRLANRLESKGFKVDSISEASHAEKPTKVKREMKENGKTS